MDFPSARPYQREALQAIVQAAADPMRPRGIIAHATGLGKGHLCRYIPSAVQTDRWLVLAHREELIDQLHDHFHIGIQGGIVGVERAEEKAPPFARTVVASVPTLKGKRLEKFEPDRFDAILIDEAHHSTAKSYRRILHHFGLLEADLKTKTIAPRVLLLGLTATPSRGDGVGLNLVFDKILHAKPLSEGIKEGWLVPIDTWEVQTGVSLDGVEITAGDYNEGQLADRLNTETRNQSCVAAYRTHCAGLKTIVFCVDVAHAKALSEAFNNAGIPAAHVSGADRDGRSRTLTWFRETPGAVLCNCMVLTEGTDIPSVEAVLLARSTRSKTLLAQMVGRGTRLAAGAYDYAQSVVLGKSSCVVVDMRDTLSTIGQEAVWIGDLFGLPPRDGEGRRIVLNGKDTLQQVEKEAAAQIAQQSRRLNLFDAAPPPSFCRLRWLPVSDQEWQIALESRERLRVVSNTIDEWVVEGFDPEAKSWGVIDRQPTQKDALLLAERWIDAYWPEAKTLGRKDASWRKDEPTEKQMELCRRFRIEVPDGATKGQVSEALDRWFAQRGSKGKARAH